MILTGTTPSWMERIRCAAARERSIFLRRWDPQSLIRTVTDRPLFRLVTVTSESRGNTSDAAVSFDESKVSPLVVRRPS